MNDHSWTLQHLPWYTNGTLVGDEYARAHRHVSECLICQQEQVNLRRINETIAQPINTLGDAANALSEINLHLDTIQEHGKNTGLSLSWNKFKILITRTPTPIKLALTIQSAALVAISLLLINSPQPSSNQNPYRTLSSGQNAHGDVRVLFAPAIQLEQQQSLLHSIDASIVSGPTSRGVYTLMLNQDKKDDSINTLQESELVDFAQPIKSNSEIK